ncbi:MAG: hypothetical protein KKF46_06080 [Nanoarchaeota archaeon]|nr:hypothetical protein [Nanoarchaeota archaeon]MBU1321901.1 hypothetical protein [Nanoarchaeota archaeon]MBU1598424.1 hypothetical protein [Nanoarchaeota archaeon]MBU2441050.1 hypothetical protein [Nanoarchaeota archaeon]
MVKNKLSKEDLEFVNALRSKLKKNKTFVECPICKSQNNLQIAPHYAHRPLKQNLFKPYSGIIIPCKSIICSDCGFVMDFSVQELGMLSKKAKSKNGNKKE